MNLDHALANRPDNSQVKAAIIVRLLRSVETDLSLSDLPEESQMTLARIIGGMGPVDRDAVNQTIEDFSEAIDRIALPSPGGYEAALETLNGQISETVAEKLVEESAMNNPEHSWVRLARLEDDKLAQIIESESIEISALLLSKLPVDKAAEVLSSIAGERARRIACTTPQIDKMSKAAVLRIARSLADEHCKAREKAFDKDAVTRVGAILNSTASARRDEVLADLDGNDPEFALKVRREIFTFASIPERIEPLDIPKVLRALDQEQLVIILGGGLAGDEDEVAAAEFVLSNMSKRMSTTIRDEINEGAPAKPSVIEETQKLLIQSIRDAIDTGEITQKEAEE